MFNYRFQQLLVGVALLSATIIHGETLEELTAEALRTNPQLLVLEASVASAQGGITSAKTWQNPELSVAPGVRRIQDAAGTNVTEFHGEFDLNQLFLFPGKRALLIAIAQRNADLSRIALEGFRFQLATAVRKAFYGQLAAEQILKLRGEQIKSARTFYEAAVKRAESGYASDFETLKGQADLIEAQKLARASTSEVISTRVELNTLLGRPASASLEVSGNLVSVPPVKTVGGYVALAMARNPSLRTQQMQADLAALNLRKTRFGRRPDFAVGPRIEYLQSEQTYGIGATVALPLWNQSHGEIQTALAEQEKEIATTAKLRAEISGAVTKAAAKLDAARDQLALYTPDFLDNLKSLMTRAEKSYAENTTTVLIYLDAKRTYFDALASYYEALSNVAMSWAELESAIGVALDFKDSPNKPQP